MTLSALQLRATRSPGSFSKRPLERCRHASSRQLGRRETSTTASPSTRFIPLPTHLPEVSTTSFSNIFSRLSAKAWRERQPQKSQDALQTLRESRRLSSALSDKAPYRIVRALADAARDPGLLKAIPKSTLRDVTELLDPEYFVVPYRDLHNTVSLITGQKYRHASLRETFGSFERIWKGLLMVREAAGQKLSLADSTHLLKSARIAGDATAARAIWQDMKRNEIVPNTECYNHFLGAVAWSEAHDKMRMKLRVKTMPGSPQPDIKEAGHISQPALELSNDLLESGLQPDEETYALMIFAMARDGRMDDVESVLKATWNIDVRQLNDSGEGASNPVQSYARGSRLHPTENLISAVALSYSINNDIPTALMLVDFISRQYQVEIKRYVFEHLFEWTFVLSEPRFNTRRVDGSTEGQLPIRSTETLLDTITSPPYNITPSMPMIDRHLKRLARRGMLRKFKEYMAESHRLFSLSQQTFRDTHKRRVLAESLAASGRLPLDRPEFDLDHLKRKEELDRITNQRNALYVERGIRYLLKGERFVAGPDQEWERRELPRMIERLREYMPETIEYKTRYNGKISLREWVT
ncbi:MAG: hypothetical protein M4579_006709 [Chaenotheca gracillima]|nr:MAG: hypothetical protein M4579_006709 [Chaenotheca gracillima]